MNIKTKEAVGRIIEVSDETVNDNEKFKDILKGARDIIGRGKMVCVLGDEGMT